jgi:hypothetical protein
VENAAKSSDIEVAHCCGDRIDRCSRKFQHLPRATHPKALLIFAWLHAGRLHEAPEKSSGLQASVTSNVSYSHAALALGGQPMLGFQYGSVAPCFIRGSKPL